MKNKLFLVLTLALGFLGCLSAAEQMTPKEHVEQRPIQGIKCDFCEKVFANKYSYSAHALYKHHDA
ncbi:hypothetical protein EBU24_04570, partial [bacterium]|nr:hypothetical protein [bacterium]